VEIITGVERRRRWRLDEKLRIVAEAEAPGRVVGHRQCVDTEMVQMGLPGGVIGKARRGRMGQALDQGAGQGAAAL
jgi:hypothetical protein